MRSAAGTALDVRGLLEQRRLLDTIAAVEARSEELGRQVLQRLRGA